MALREELDDLELILDIEIPRLVRRIPHRWRERYAEEWSADVAGAHELGLDPWEVLDGARRTARRLATRDLGDIATGRVLHLPWLVVGPALVTGAVEYFLALLLIPWADAPWVTTTLFTCGDVWRWCGPASWLLLLLAPWHHAPARARAIGVAAVLCQVAMALRLRGSVLESDGTAVTDLSTWWMTLVSVAPFVATALAARQLVLERRA